MRQVYVYVANKCVLNKNPTGFLNEHFQIWSSDILLSEDEICFSASLNIIHNATNLINNLSFITYF